MIYLDTSALGALFFRETSAQEVLAALERAGNQTLAVSAWTLTEMASVGAIKERTGQIGSPDRAAGLAAFQRFVTDSLTLVEVDPGDFRTAAALLDLSSTGLRAADALHLAVTRRLRAHFATLDKRQGAAAIQFGISLFPLTGTPNAQ